MYDLVIAGGGPAGLTATVYAARKGTNLLLLTHDIGGQVLWTMGVENYMGFQFVGGSELIGKFEDQVKQFPVDIKTEQRAKTISIEDSGFLVSTEAGDEYQSRAVIVATGKRPRMLGVPGEERLRGRGVTYCSVCDGPVFTGEKVAVIGGGNSALEAADDMAKIAEHVDLVSITPLTGDQVLIDKVESATNVTKFLEHEVVEIEGQNRVEGVIVRDLKSREQRNLQVSGIFVEIGLVPNSELVKDIVNLNQMGEIRVNCADETNVPGLFAAGDVTSVPEKQIVISAGEGAKAAIQAHRYLQRL
jgi:alkyl hydroperoxide reductase subunit F